MAFRIQRVAKQGSSKDDPKYLLGRSLTPEPFNYSQATQTRVSPGKERAGGAEHRCKACRYQLTELSNKTVHRPDPAPTGPREPANSPRFSRPQPHSSTSTSR